MHVLAAPQELETRGRPVCAAIGMFDGVHLGHQRVLQQALSDARAQNGHAVAITFDRHPKAVVAPQRTPPLIYPLPQRLHTLARLGLDAALVLPFTEDLRQQTADTFIRNLARDLHPLASLCIGEGFHFGHQRSGNVQLLKALGRELAFQVHAIPPVTFDGATVRSTRIRNLVRQGDLTSVGRLLGRPYSLRSTVVPGDQLGRTLGFPTANLLLPGCVLPPHGVYAAWAAAGDQEQPAVVNLGLRPTLQQPAPEVRLEVHLLTATPDLRGATIEVRFVSRLRPELRFASLEALRQQIGEDVKRARHLLLGD